MAIESSSRNWVAMQAEVTTGVAAIDSSGSATRIRFTDSPGLVLNRGQIVSNEKRADAVRNMGRLGGKSVTGSYNGEVTVGGAMDHFFKSILRATPSAAVTRTYDNSAGLTSLEITSTSQITQVGSTSFVGVIFVGDVVRLAGMSTAANNDINLRVTSVAANVLNVAGTPLTVQGADTSATLTRYKKLSTPTTPVRYSWTIEQHRLDPDQSERFVGCRLIGLQLNLPPNGNATWVATFLGMDGTVLATAASPYFTDPTLTTGVALVADDGAIRYNGADVATFTGLTLDFQIAAAGQPVIGSMVSPDIFDNDLTVTGQITGLRSSLANLALYHAETEFELSAMLVEPEAAPADFIHIFLPRVKIAAASAPIGGGDGPIIETLGLMMGPKTAATGYNGSVASITTSAA